MTKSLVSRDLSHLLPAVMAAILTFLVTVTLTFPPFANAGCVTGSCGGFTAGGNAQNGGIGYARYFGDQGIAWAQKIGGSEVESKVTLGGNACGPTCPQGKFKIEAAAFETVLTGAEASGIEVLVENAGEASAETLAYWQKEE